MLYEVITVLAHQAVGQFQVDVRAGRRGRQRCAIERCEGEAEDVLGQRDALA